MTQNVLTTTQVRNRINAFGKSLILYVIILTVFRYGLFLFEKYFPQIFFDKNPMMVFYLGINFLILVLSLIPFSIAGNKLSLNMTQYFKKGISIGNLFVYTCVCIGIHFIFTSFMSLFSIFFSLKFSSLSFIGNYKSVDYIITNIAYIVYIIIIKPYCDEFVFRGVIQRSLGIFGRYFGVISSALLYAISQGNIIEAVPAFFVGWFLSLVTIKYHSIKPTILIQMFMSIFLYALMIIPDKMVWIIQVLIIIVYVVVALFLFSKHRRFFNDVTSVFNGQLWKLLFTSYSIIIVVFIFFINIALSVFLN